MSTSLDRSRGVFLVERYVPGGAKETAREHARRAHEVTATDVRYLGTILLPDDETSFCLFAGPSVEAVAALNNDAGLPFTRIVATVTLDALAALLARELGLT
jgi:hypothetical protein